MKISSNIIEAGNWLIQNKVIAIPTETVYGLAASIYNEEAIQSIYKIKNRPLNNPLIIHIKSEKELHKYVSEIPTKASLLAKTFWPGPLTLVLPKSALVPHYITANKNSVAIRVPDHLTTLKLLDRLHFPLAAPSANPSNCVSATKAEHVKTYFGDKIPFILDGGACKKGLESTIIGFENEAPVIYRLGALSLEIIEKVIGPVTLKNQIKNSPDAPGMFSKHYAPRTPLYIVDNMDAFLKTTPFTAIAYLGFNKGHKHSKISGNYLLSPQKKLDQAARNLYQTLIAIDTKEYEVIVTQLFPDENLGKSINDRLKRASHQPK